MTSPCPTPGGRPHAHHHQGPAPWACPRDCETGAPWPAHGAPVSQFAHNREAPVSRLAASSFALCLAPVHFAEAPRRAPPPPWRFPSCPVIGSALLLHATCGLVMACTFPPRLIHPFHIHIVQIDCPNPSPTRHQTTHIVRQENHPSSQHTTPHRRSHQDHDDAGLPPGHLPAGPPLLPPPRPGHRFRRGRPRGKTSGAASPPPPGRRRHPTWARAAAAVWEGVNHGYPSDYSSVHRNPSPIE